MKYDDKIIKELEEAKKNNEASLQNIDEEIIKTHKELEKLEKKEKQLIENFESERCKKIVNYLRYYRFIRNKSKNILDELHKIYKDLSDHDIVTYENKYQSDSMDALSMERDDTVTYVEFKECLKSFLDQKDIDNWDVYCNSVNMQKYSTTTMTKTFIYTSYLEEYCNLLLNEACNEFGHDYKVYDKKIVVDLQPYIDLDRYIHEGHIRYSCICRNCKKVKSFDNKVINYFGVNQSSIDSFIHTIELVKDSNSYRETVMPVLKLTK